MTTKRPARKKYDWRIVEQDSRGAVYEYFGSTLAVDSYEAMQEATRLCEARGHDVVKLEVTINGLLVASRKYTGTGYSTRIKPDPTASGADTSVKHLPVASRREGTTSTAPPAAASKAAPPKEAEPPFDGLRLVRTRKQPPKMLVKDQYKLAKED